jgi:hypothetical protein
LADQAATSIQNEPMKPFGQMRKVSYFYGLVVGWGGRIRTSAWGNQNPLPYHLATPQ